MGSSGQQQGGTRRGAVRVDAHNTAEVLHGRLSLPGLPQASQSPVEAVVDEATGGGRARSRVSSGSDAVRWTLRPWPSKMRLRTAFADEVVVVGFGADVRRTRAKRLAAFTAGGVLCVKDVQPDDADIGQRTHEAVQATFAVAATTAAGAGVCLGLATDRDNLLAGLGYTAHGLRSWITEVRDRCSRTQALSVNPYSCLRHLPKPPLV